jgi:DNA (cytosine-5)-methyltransferase 1
LKVPKGYRRLSPIELEINAFPDDHTESWKVYLTQNIVITMGNALVVGVIEKNGNALKAKINSYE